MLSTTVLHLPSQCGLVLFGKDSPVSLESGHSGKTHILQPLPASHRHAYSWEKEEGFYDVEEPSQGNDLLTQVGHQLTVDANEEYKQENLKEKCISL